MALTSLLTLNPPGALIVLLQKATTPSTAWKEHEALPSGNSSLMNSYLPLTSRLTIHPYRLEPVTSPGSLPFSPLLQEAFPDMP